MGKIDTDQMKSGETLLTTIQKYIQLKKNGNEYEACCPFHDEKTPSFSVVPDKGFYHCFGCGAHGDTIDFVSEYEGVGFKEAAKIISGETITSNGATTKRHPVKPAHDPYEGIKILPVPVDAELNEKSQIWNPKRDKYTQYSSITSTFTYRDPDGNTLGHVIRIDFDEKTKITPTITWCSIPGKEDGWCHKIFDAPRPLYAQEFLVGSKKPVLIVEGEKACDAADELLSDKYDVICWHGGTNAISKTDWSILKGRNILMWADMDTVGMECILGVEKHGIWKSGVGDYLVEAGAATIKYIALDESKEKGWDAADALAEGWNQQTVIAWAKKFVHQFVAQDLADIPVINEPENTYDDHDHYLEHYGENVVPISDEIKIVDYESLLKMKDSDPTKINPKLTHNAMVLFNYHPDMTGVFAYNDNANSVDIVKAAPWDDKHSKVPRSTSDSDDVNAKAWLECNEVVIGISDVRGAINSVACRNRYNPLTDYVNSLEWDGIPRLDKWLITYLGVPESEYSILVGRKTLIGGIARALKPGCKMDTMLILEGAQGLKKSTAIETLFSTEFFTDEIHNIGSKDAAMQMQGKWGIEMAELGALSRSEATSQKEFISRPTDRFRPPYSRAVIESPRTSIFFGTVNLEGGYLKDATGARRFFPVRCYMIDIVAIRRDRSQIWAEAKAAYLSGEKWWITDTESHLVADEQSERYEGDAYSELIDDYLIGKSEVTTAEVLNKGLEIPIGQWTRSNEIRVAKHLTTRGWDRKRMMRGGVRQYVFCK